MTDDDIVLEEEDGEGNVKSPEQKLKELRDAVKRAQKERDEYLDGWQRSKADYVNLKKRSEEERLTLSQYANQGLLEALLPILDSFEQALQHDSGTGGIQEGLKNTYGQLVRTLESTGLTAFNPVGEAFDPSKHESVEIVAVDSAKMDNIVTKVHQKGYTLNGRIIRPARVAVGHYQE